MREKYNSDAFDFIPESFVLPDQWESFFEAFVRQGKKIKKIKKNEGERVLRYNYWICKPCSSS